MVSLGSKKFVVIELLNQSLYLATDLSQLLDDIPLSSCDNEAMISTGGSADATTCDGPDFACMFILNVKINGVGVTLHACLKLNKAAGAILGKLQKSYLPCFGRRYPTNCSQNEKSGWCNCFCIILTHFQHKFTNIGSCLYNLQDRGSAMGSTSLLPCQAPKT